MATWTGDKPSWRANLLSDRQALCQLSVELNVDTNIDGCVHAAITRAAGASKWAAVQTGPRAIGGYGSTANYVFHVVGPDFRAASTC